MLALLIVKVKRTRTWSQRQLGRSTKNILVPIQLSWQDLYGTETFPPVLRSSKAIKLASWIARALKFIFCHFMVWGGLGPGVY